MGLALLDPVALGGEEWMGHSQDWPHVHSAMASLCQAPSPSLDRSHGTLSARKAQSLGAILGKLLYSTVINNRQELLGQRIVLCSKEKNIFPFLLWHRCFDIGRWYFGDILEALHQFQFDRYWFFCHHSAGAIAEGFSWSIICQKMRHNFINVPTSWWIFPPVHNSKFRLIQLIRGTCTKSPFYLQRSSN